MVLSCPAVFSVEGIFPLTDIRPGAYSLSIIFQVMFIRKP